MSNSDIEDIAARIRGRIAADPKLQKYVNECLGTAHTPPPRPTPVTPQARPQSTAAPKAQATAGKRWWQFWK